MHKPPTADTRSSEFKTFGASILDDQIDGLTVTLDPEADEICVIAETTHYGTTGVPEITGRSAARGHRRW